MGLKRNVGNRSAPLLECMEEEFQPETIEGYHCDTCKKPTTATKQGRFWRIPKFFIITLRRFTPFGTRDNLSLSYGGEALHLSELFDSQSMEQSRTQDFELFATIDHHGHMMGGHYTSQCYNPVWKKWYQCDDETILEIQKPFLGPQTYILLFRAVPSRRAAEA